MKVADDWGGEERTRVRGIEGSRDLGGRPMDQRR
jgi:hypothetical protein